MKKALLKTVAVLGVWGATLGFQYLSLQAFFPLYKAVCSINDFLMIMFADLVFPLVGFFIPVAIGAHGTRWVIEKINNNNRQETAKEGESK